MPVSGAYDEVIHAATEAAFGPRYVDGFAFLPRSEPLAVCQKCGATVADKARHARWHREQELR